MRAAEYNLTIEQGSTFDLELQYTDADGDPVDITGMTVRCQGRETVEDATTLFDWDTAGGEITLSDPSNGVFKFAVAAVQTAALDFRRGVFDIELVAGAVVRRIVEGNVILSKEVTR